MSESNNQKVYVNFTKDPLVYEEQATFKYVMVLIISTCIIKLDVKNLWKTSHYDQGSGWRGQGSITHIGAFQ
jgi:hypothetical protein